MHTGFSTGVTVSALATQRQALSDQLSCWQVDQWFRQDESRRSVVLRRHDGSPALINRSSFYQHMLGPAGFGWALYANKPVSVLPTNSDLVVEADTPAVVAALCLLVEQRVSSSDDLLVVGGGEPATICTSTLFAELARDQTQQAGRLEALVQNLSDVIVVVDESGLVRYSTASTARTNSQDGFGELGSNSIDDVHPDDRAMFRRLLIEACELPGTTMRGELRLRDIADGYLLVAVAVTDQRSHAGIGGIVLTYRDITEHRAFEQKLRHLALHDGLTGLANRALLQDRISHALAGATRSRASLGLLYIDLDGFKAVNDAWGHSTGDSLLQAVSAVLLSQTRPADTVARMGGDEFVVLLEQLRTPSDASGFAARIHQALEEVVIDGLHIRVSCSVGIAASCELQRGVQLAGTDCADAEELIRRADAAMYVAKCEGRSRTKWWEESLERQMAANSKFSSELASAAERSDLRVHYQPIVNVDDGLICGFEALVRWQHPIEGLIPPGNFIPLAERNGAITPITLWVLNQACTDGACLINKRAAPLTMAVNLSAVELARPGLAEDVSRILAATNFPASLLELEITETALVTNFALARASISRLKATGVTIAIDDFGTGYSSLSYLHELPVDRVKIDKTFTDRVTDEAGGSLVRGVIDLAHSLHLRVTAEGIETAPQARALARFRCDQGQGFYHAYPVPIDQLEATMPLGEPARCSGDAMTTSVRANAE